ncbi:hypothetical protein SDC9_183872 [bioreactor metagenome]|uniref:Uncharacterized protein n=1 Tax=bioreactor metagenome TaxID=1076179 RepID=A0A645HL76_9ZZZZ
MQRPGIGDSLVGGTHVRLGDDFEQRRTGTVEVDAGFAVKIFVQRLAGILFEMGAGQVDRLLVGLVAATDGDGDRPALHHR